MKKYIKQKIANVYTELELKKDKVKPSSQNKIYFPIEDGKDTYLIKKTKEKFNLCDQGLPIPPVNLRLDYGRNDEEYLNGKIQIDKMLDILRENGYSIKDNSKILDFGCGAGRMIRWLKRYSDKSEIWGTDISSEHIYWANKYLKPPFNFATTTTVPHLPFEDNYFNLIYAGSVFTHIDDLADAWLLELRRILKKDGLAYITIHDRHSIDLLDTIPIWKKTWINKIINESALFQNNVNEFGAFVKYRGSNSQVFYDIDYFCASFKNIFDIVSIIPEAYGYQTGILLKKR